MPARAASYRRRATKSMTFMANEMWTSTTLNGAVTFGWPGTVKPKVARLIVSLASCPPALSCGRRAERASCARASASRVLVVAMRTAVPASSARLIASARERRIAAGAAPAGAVPWPEAGTAIAGARASSAARCVSS